LKKNKQYLNLIVIDDYPILNKQQEKAVTKLYTQARHFGATVIYLQQLYFQLSRGIRNNLTHIVIFNNNNKKK